MEHLERERTYFTLVDESGKGHPAMEYVAGTLDEEPTFQIVPLKRFVKLIGSGEPLEAAGEGQFVGARSRRKFSAGQG